MSSEKDYLIDDEKLNNQSWACVSLITPATLKGCSKYLLKVRGVYGNQDRATDRANDLHKKDPTFGVYKVEVGKWIAWSDNQNKDLDPNDELNELMREYKKERSESKMLHEKRKDELKNKTTTALPDTVHNTEPTGSKEEVEVSDNVNKISYLTEDDELSNQKFYCVSFLTPDQLENKDNENKFSVRGFKIRGMFNNEEDAKEYCSKLHKCDQNHNIYVANMGHWVSWSDNTENAEDFEYSNKDLNNLMKSHKENQQKAKLFNAQQKQDMMNESLNSIKKDDKVSNIVNEIIEESFEEEINLEDINKTDDDDTDLDQVNKELAEAQKMYEKMLEEENKLN